MLSTRVELELPFPPSVNGLFSQNRRTGRRFVSKQYKAWRDEAGWRIRVAHLQKLTYPVDIHIALTPCDKRRRDADNFVKPLLDSLVQQGVLKDDSGDFVRRIDTIWKPPDSAAPKATVTITTASAGGQKRSTMELMQLEG